MEQATLSMDILYIIGQLCPVGDVTALQRVHPEWRTALTRAAKTRKSAAVTPFPDHTFHTLDSFAASLMLIRREDVLGTRYFKLYNDSGDGTLTENEESIRQFFASNPSLGNIELTHLTDFMLSQINERFPHLRALAFHKLGPRVPQFSDYPNLCSNLQILVLGVDAGDDLVQQSCSAFSGLRNVTFVSPVDETDYWDHDIHLHSLASIPASVKEVYFGTRIVRFGAGADAVTSLKDLVRGSNLRTITHLEILQPEPYHLDLFVNDVLPSFSQLETLALNLTNTQNAISCPDTDPTSCQQPHLQPALPHLKSLTLILDSSISLTHVFGPRPELQVLRISGILAKDDIHGHMTYFDVPQMEEIVTCAPNLTYLCVLPFALNAELDQQRMNAYIDVIRRLANLQTLHLPHTPFDDVIVLLLSSLIKLKKIEFVGPVCDEVVTRVQQVRREKKLPFEIGHRQERHYCTCPYSQTGVRSRNH